MSSTNKVAVMSPEQERLLHEAAVNSKEALVKIDDLHRTLYRNGFQERLKTVEGWVKEHPGVHCIGKKLMDEHVQGDLAKEKHIRALRWRKADVMLAVGIALVAGLPAWLRFFGVGG